MRKLASIKQISHIVPIKDADAIECAVIESGWPVVVRKGEYKVGDEVIYCEPDCWIPKELAPFLCKGEPKEYNGVVGERLRTIKLRGQLSQGLVLPRTQAPDAVLGDVVCEQLGIQKWDAPIPACLAGEVKGNFPGFVPKTDLERIQNMADILGSSEFFEVTTKLDGASCTIYSNQGEFGVCSRNLDLKETEGNSFWRAAKKDKYDLLPSYCQAIDCDLAIQAELIGPGIQGNPEKLTEVSLYVFDVYDIRKGRYLNPEERWQTLQNLEDWGIELRRVPYLGERTLTGFTDVNALLNFAEGSSLTAINREGVVFKSMTSQVRFKAIANSYLLKDK